MATQEINSTNWDQFCNRFKELHQGQLITIEQINTMGAREQIAEKIPLQDIQFQKTTGCSDRMIVVAKEPGGREVQHIIIEPIHVKVRQEAEGSKGLQIDAETGSTLIRFSSGKLEELMQGME
ncbi:MAG: DUF5335 family protein [Verrucomicrobiales bacterium]